MRFPKVDKEKIKEKRQKTFSTNNNNQRGARHTRCDAITVNFPMQKHTSRLNAGFTLIEILIVIGIIAILATIVLIAINPARQFRQARDTQRVSNVNALLNAIGQYIADNKGAIPSEITTAIQTISDTGAELCTDLVPKYLPSMVFDPGATVVDCPTVTVYNTAYSVVKDAQGRITVSATREEPAGTISVTR